MGFRRATGTFIGLAAVVGLVSCTGDPPTPPVTTVPSSAAIDAVAGGDTYAPYSARTPAVPSPALAMAFNVYARSVTPIDADTVLISNYSEILRFEESTGTVQRIAGAGTDASTGTTSDGTDLPDAFGGPATAAFLGEPSQIVHAPDGTVYFVPNSGSWIAAVTPEGTLSKVAGTGAGPSGDGGPAVNAGVVPRALTLGPDGDLYFVQQIDGLGASVRRIDVQTGTIGTVYGPPGVPWSDADPLDRLDVAPDGTIRDIGFDATDGRLSVRELTGAGPVDVPIAGACADELYGTVLNGELSDGRRQVLTADRLHVCTVDLTTGASERTAVDPLAIERLNASPPDLASISEFALGPDGRRWFVAWDFDPEGNNESLRLYRWQPGG